MHEDYTVAVVGAGLVGERLVAELRRRKFPLKELRILARTERRSVLAGETFEVGVAEPDAFDGVDFAFFAGTEGEKGAAVQLAPKAIERGAVVIDNGSDFRLDPEVPLVVPEVNAGALQDHNGLIANANCSTTQMVVTLAPLARDFGLKKVVVSTYQGRLRLRAERGRCAGERPGRRLSKSDYRQRAALDRGRRRRRLHDRRDEDARGVPQDPGPP